MEWIIPIGGKGTRTKSLGEFKPFIRIRGVKMLTWFLLSIKHNISPKDKFTFITTEYFAQRFKVYPEIEKIFSFLEIRNKLELAICQENLSGVSATLCLIKYPLQTSKPVVVIYPDQYIDFDLPLKIESGTGYMPISADFGTTKGYVEIKDGLISHFTEKVPISNLASAGVYISHSGNALLKAIEKQMRMNQPGQNGEFCTGPAFNFLIEEGHKIYPLLVRVKYDLGNVSEIEHFSNTPLAISLGKIFTEEINLSEAGLDKKFKRLYLFEQSLSQSF